MRIDDPCNSDHSVAGSVLVVASDRLSMGAQGVTSDVAKRWIRMFDTPHLTVAGRPGPAAHTLPPRKPFNHLDAPSACPEVVGAIEEFIPAFLSGVSGKARPAAAGGLLSHEIGQAGLVIFALPNPNFSRGHLRGLTTRPFTPAACNSPRFTSPGRLSCHRSQQPLIMARGIASPIARHAGP